MKHSFKKLISLLIAAIMLFSMLPVSALGSSDSAGETVSVSGGSSDTGVFGHIHTERTGGGRSLTQAYLNGEIDDTRDPLPAKYDSRDYGYITSVKNQNPYGTCWAHASVAAVEAYMIKHGIINAQTGSPATTSMNLSEYHLAWFNYTSAYDKLGMLTGDKTTPSSSYLNLGGTAYHSTYTFMRGTGPAAESTSALAYSAASSSGLNSQYAYNYNVARVTDVVWIPTSNRDAVKRAIMEYGAGYIAYYHSDSYVSSAGGYCYKSSQYANHAVTVVGWDDNYATSNFNSNARPSSPGAWIIKNSWGSSWGRSGYFYLSYEDVPSRNEDCAFYKAVNSDVYTNCYQYDGTTNDTSSKTLGNNASVANIFTAKASETITAVAFAPGDEATSYTIKVYKNLSSSTNPTSGTLMSTKTGSVDFPGYHTAVLDTPVPINNGETFSVVITLSVRSGSVHMPYDASANYSWVSWTHKNNGNTSYYKEANSSSWSDCPSNGDFRIKAFTGIAQASYTVNAVSNNSSYGSVQVSGNTITANPYSGYYLADAYVSSGNAEISISGNTITVTPASDCTITVVFAPRELVTINLYACGIPESYINVYSGDTVQLPSSVSFVPDGWNFIGWSEAPINDNGGDDDIKAAPPYYKPGSSYVVGNNFALYALYSMVEGGGTGETVYELVNAGNERGEFDGRYVITSGMDSSLVALKSLASTVSLESASAGGSIPYASTGMYLDGSMLRNVSDEYVFDIQSNGSSYTISNASTGSFIGAYSGTLWNLDSNYSASQWINWNIEYDGSYNCMKVENPNGGGTYPYLVKGSNGYFVVNSTYTANKTYFWKETGVGTISYSTNPYGSVVPDPTPEPTAEPTPVPTEVPTPVPTAEPTPVPNNLTAPTGVMISLVDRKPYITWNTVSGASSYDVYRSADDTREYAFVATFYTNSFTDTSELSGFQTYSYMVCAKDNYGNVSEFSSAVSIETFGINAPADISGYLIDQMPTIFWSACADAAYYEIYRGTSLVGSYTHIGDVYDTAFTDCDTLTPLQKYYYKVRARDDFGTVGTFSDAIPVIAYGIKAPENLRATLVNSFPTLTWSGAANATGYQIYRSTKQTSGFTLVGTASGTSFTDTSSLESLKYYYKVQGIDDFGNVGEFSDAVSVTVQPHDFAAPTGVKGKMSGGCPYLVWDFVTGAAEYEIYRSVGGEYTLIGSTAKRYYSDRNFAGGTTYSYKIKAVNGGSSSPMSDAVSVTTPVTELDAPTGFKGKMSGGCPYLVWNFVTGATKYEIWRTGADGNCTLIGITTKRYFSDTDFQDGVTYRYKVKALNSISASQFSAEVSVTTPATELSAPIDVRGKMSGGTPYLTWAEVTGATGYEIWRADSNGNYVLIGSTAKRYFSDTNFQRGITYTYKIKAVNNLTESPLSNAVSVFAK